MEISKGDLVELTYNGVVRIQPKRPAIAPVGVGP